MYLGALPSCNAAMSRQCCNVAGDSLFAGLSMAPSAATPSAASSTPTRQASVAAPLDDNLFSGLDLAGGGLTPGTAPQPDQLSGSQNGRWEWLVLHAMQHER